MNLKTDAWKEFFLHDLYKVEMGNGFDKNKMDYFNPSVNFVSRVSYNNGIDDFVDYVDGVEPYNAGLLTVALGGSYLGACFVQDKPFYTAQNVAVLTPLFKEMTHTVNLFISTLVRFECKSKYYAFGRELNAHIGRDFSIKLPIISNGIPNWQFIENYIKHLNYRPITTKIKQKILPQLEISKWKSFRVKNLFNMLNGKGITQDEISENEGDFIAVQSSEENNGVMGKISLDYCKLMNYTYTEKPCLTVARSGSAGFVSYQADGCVVGDSAKILLLNDDIATENHYLFLQTLLTANRFKYDYGRKVTEDKYLNEYISLPVKHNIDGTIYIDKSCRYSEEGFVPDWEFIDVYINSLHYSDRLKTTKK